MRSPLALLLMLLMLAILLLLSVKGCTTNQTGTVDGTVIVDGSPLGGFEIQYYSQETGASYFGYAKAAGDYELFGSMGRRDIPVGEYRVTVVPTPMVEGVPIPKVRLPVGYTDESRAELIKAVEAGENQINLEVKSIQ